MMASAAEVKGHKKSSKGKLRGRFLLSRPSFDTSALQQDADSGGGGGGGDDRDSASGGAANKSSRTKFLFRSKSEDRMRNTRIQQLPTPPPTTAPAPTPAAAAAAPTSTMQHYYATRTIGPTQTPRSPPPSYGSTSSSAGGAAGAQQPSAKQGAAWPPSYAEATYAAAGAAAVAAVSHPCSVDYCRCVHCRTGYLSLDDEEEERDSSADAVFPMETHVLMQEVLADGMSLCSVM